MSSHKNGLTADQTRFVNQARAEEKERQAGYRDRALKLFPWVCGRCTREFSHKNVRELTVHHRDHNHDNNPADGSNWELLCVYCHDHEHSRGIQEDREQPLNTESPPQDHLSHSPFAALGKHFKNES